MDYVEGTVEFFLDGVNWTGPDGIPSRLLEHLWISGAAVLLAALIALPIALLLGHVGRGGVLAVNVSNGGRAIPTLAVLILLALSPVGFGNRATVVALTLFAIPPILTNAYVGMREVDRDVKEAASGMGMTGGQLLRRVELPLALPLIAAGLRTAAVQVVATATLAALVAGGGLGRYIVDGYGTQNYPKVYAGVLLVAVLALVTEVILGTLQRRLTPGASARGAQPPQRERDADRALAGSRR